MNSPEDTLQSRSQCDDVPGLCANCFHAEHPDGPCEYERGDSWVRGWQPSQPTVLMAMGPCGCANYEPADAEDLLSREGKI